MHNLKTAKETNTLSSGNAGSSYKNISMVRMRNTILLGGNYTLKEIIKSIEYGYYLVTPGIGKTDLLGNFEGINCYLMADNKEIWFDTQWLDKEDCKNLQTSLTTWIDNIKSE